jgi:tRNA dimethylallyltransferase
MIQYEGKIIVIAGPTASGKSSIAINLAKQLNGYIINGDSRQIYKHIDIGSAKPTPDEILDDYIWVIDGVKHFLFDFVDPKEQFSLFKYQQLVSNVLNTQKGIPILVGGTGLYIDSVIFNYNLKKRELVHSDEFSELSIEQLQEKASKYLPEMTESDRSNRHRLIRAIQRKGLGRKKGDVLDNIYFVIDVEKETLKERIKERIDGMFKDGLLEENKKLLEMGYTYRDPGLNSIGYKEFEGYFNNTATLEEIKENIYRNTLAYAKRQRTWFKRNKDSIWSSNYEEISQLASNFITGE